MNKTIVILLSVLFSISLYYNFDIRMHARDVEIIPEVRDLRAYKDNTLISSQVLAYGIYEKEVYALGYDGYSVYNFDTGEKKNYDTGNLKEKKRYSGEGDSIPPKKVVKLSSYEEFSEKEKHRFDEIIFRWTSNRINLYPYYQSDREKSIIDVKRLVYITYVSRGLSLGGIGYVYSGDSFFKLDAENETVYVYYNSLLGSGISERYRERLQKSYGDNLVEVKSFSEFSETDRDIFLAIRRDYLNDKKEKDNLVVENLI